MTIRKAIALGAVLTLAVVAWGCDSRRVGAVDHEQCDTICSFEISYLHTDYFQMFPIPLEVSDGWVMYTLSDTTGTNSPHDPEIFGLNTHNGDVEQVTFNDSLTNLLDAEGRSVLYTESTGTYMDPVDLRFRTASGTTIALGRYDHVYPAYSRGFYTTAPRRFIEGRTVTWAAEGTVNFYNGSTVVEVARSESYGAASPYLSDGTIVFSSGDSNDSEIFRWKSGELSQLTDNDVSDRLPVTSGGRVFWMCDFQICMWEAGHTRVLDTGDCLEPDTHQGQAAWTCDDAIRFFDGRAVSTVSSSDFIPGGARINNGRIVWLEVDYGDPPDYYDGRGTLYFWDGLETYEFAQLGVPCMSCDAYWPPIELSFSGDLIAWSYAVDPDEDPPWPRDGDNCAYARVIEHRDCSSR